MNSLAKVIITDDEVYKIGEFIIEVRNVLDDRSCLLSETTFKRLWLFWWTFDTLAELKPRHYEWVEIYEYCYIDEKGYNLHPSNNMRTLIDIYRLGVVSNEIYLDSDSAKVLSLFRRTTEGD